MLIFLRERDWRKGVKQIYRDPGFERGNIEEISGEWPGYRERPAPSPCSSIASTPVGLGFHKRPV